MSKPDWKKWPNLAKAWDAYGHSIGRDSLFDMKSDRGAYAALAWMEEGEVNYADLASPDGGKTWEMQNDGHEPVPLAIWKKMRVAPECDWLELPGEGRA